MLSLLALARLTPNPAAAQLATVVTLICRVARQTTTVALTFDDGPYIYETEIATTLKKRRHHGYLLRKRKQLYVPPHLPPYLSPSNEWFFRSCIYDDAMVKSIQNAASGTGPSLIHPIPSCFPHVPLMCNILYTDSALPGISIRLQH
ncbi:hypothetical protein K439DRAFT_1616102 [Ramaria rubella]|nr:hypothetical protein K439DRAFT_1616102 [Ramaria rubella]